MLVAVGFAAVQIPPCLFDMIYKNISHFLFFKDKRALFSRALVSVCLVQTLRTVTFWSREVAALSRQRNNNNINNNCPFGNFFFFFPQSSRKKNNNNKKKTLNCFGNAERFFQTPPAPQGFGSRSDACFSWQTQDYFRVKKKQKQYRSFNDKSEFLKKDKNNNTDDLLCRH